MVASANRELLYADCLPPLLPSRLRSILLHEIDLRSQKKTSADRKQSTADKEQKDRRATKRRRGGRRGGGNSNRNGVHGNIAKNDRGNYAAAAIVLRGGSVPPENQRRRSEVDILQSG